MLPLASRFEIAIAFVLLLRAWHAFLTTTAAEASLTRRLPYA
jgi:hypothetical protein